jgi:hypothetical protein
MVAPKSTGAVRRRAHPDDNRPRIRPSPKSLRKLAGKPLVSKPSPHDRTFRDSVADIGRRLQVIGAIAVTAEAALRAQNCDQDGDIAQCLRYGVVDALTTQIERLSQLLCPRAAGDAS